MAVVVLVVVLSVGFAKGCHGVAASFDLFAGCCGFVCWWQMWLHSLVMPQVVTAVVASFDSSFVRSSGGSCGFA